MNPVKIYIDKRELNGHVAVELERLGCELSFHVLEVGDIIVSDRVCFERKTPTDFFKSLFDERKLFGQLIDLKNSYEIPILLFEGTDDDMFTTRRTDPVKVQGIINSIALMRIPIIYTVNVKGTAMVINSIAKKEQSEEHRSPALHGRRSHMDIYEQLVYFMSGMTDCDVGPEQAKKLLAHFGSVERIVFAEVEDLMKVDRIGEATAKKITEFFTRRYNAKKE